MAAKFELEIFDGKGDFSLWKKKMKALLVQQKVAKALDDPSKLAGAKTAEEIVELQEIAFSSIILHLADNVLRKIHDAKTARELNCYNRHVGRRDNVTLHQSVSMLLKRENTFQKFAALT
ncbi:uncharacterized protein LOC111024471 isoform X3 [Momordica charantia]|uniref:Uncharacterized protein LOC111024471 isoform X3 n=1 Tax=Momordica charantia TaxID=3673 RepID=A0A6J1DZD8_MOMCH|nr:uncharacterized protein LOC111024471 isoform X3 [Momordica charantia]